MSLTRDGWIDDRPYTVIREPDAGRPLKYVCLKCHAETGADPDVFAAHSCEEHSGRELQVDTSGYEEIDATDPALERAVDLGVDITAIEGTGQDGRVLVEDVEDAVEED